MRWCWPCLLLLTLCLGTQAAAAQAPWPARPSSHGFQPLSETLQREKPRDPGAFARGAAIFGSVSAGLLFGGAIAIAAVDDLPSERVTRGFWLGTATLSSPIIALGAYTARKRARVDGFKGVRLLGWTSWTFAIANGILQWYEAFQGQSQPWGLTVGLGALGAMATLPLSLDAFVCARRATMRRFLSNVQLGPLSLRARF